MDQTIPFYIHRINTRGVLKTGQVPRRSLPMVGFIYLVGGEVLVEVERESFLCSAGHLLLIPAGRSFAILHYIDAVGYAGGFPSTSLPLRLSLMDHPLQQAFWFDEGTFLGELFNMLVTAFGQGDREFVEKGTDLLLTRVKSSVSVRLPEMVSGFLERVFREGDPVLPAADYADAMGVTLNYLNRQVKRATGHPVSHWIERPRINRAKRLLKETGLPIIDVGTAVGLDDQAYFARFFRRLTGMTPTAFRKAMHE